MMSKFNAENERIKRRYFPYLREAQRFDEASVDAMAKALGRFELHLKHRDFKQFHINQAVAFKRHLAKQCNERTGEVLSKSTLHHTLTALRNFFHWLAGQHGSRSRLSYEDANYFNLSEKEVCVAQAQRESRSPTLEQVLGVIRAMPTDTIPERRDRAVIASRKAYDRNFYGPFANISIAWAAKTSGLARLEARRRITPPPFLYLCRMLGAGIRRGRSPSSV